MPVCCSRDMLRFALTQSLSPRRGGLFWQSLDCPDRLHSLSPGSALRNVVLRGGEGEDTAWIVKVELLQHIRMTGYFLSKGDGGAWSSQAGGQHNLLLIHGVEK